MHLRHADWGNPRTSCASNPQGKSWYDEVERSNDRASTRSSFSLKRPQPALLALLASGYTPVYPCHVSPADMRTNPIGTGPFKFVEFKANEIIKLVRNPDYWKKGLPHLDGIEFTIIPNRSTAILAFVAGKFDMTFPTEVTIPLLKDVKSQAPNAVCVVEPINVTTNIIVNSSSPPFDNLDIRRAGAGARPQGLHLDPVRGTGRYRRHHGAGAGRTMGHAQGNDGNDSGYGPDINANREEARKLMQRRAMARTSICRSRSRPATFRSTAIPPSS